ncbi:MAG: MFS transporter [Acidimicrobiia bacterium]
MTTRVKAARDYWLLWTGSGLSNLGDGIRLTALPLLAATLTRDPLAVSGVFAATTAPWIVFGPIGGSLVDRANRQRLMVWGQLARGLTVAGLAVVVATGQVAMWHLYLVGVVIGIGEVLVDSSSQAAIPLLAGNLDLEQANSRLMAAEFALNDLIGGPVGAFLFTLAAAVPFGIDSATFILGALLISLIRTPMQQVRPESRQTMRADILEGIRFVWRHDLLRGLALSVALANFSMGAGGSVLVLLAIDALGMTDPQYGLLVGLGSIGGLIGAVTASRISFRIGRRWTMTSGAGLLALGQLTLGLAIGGVMAGAGLFLGLFGATIFSVVGRSLRQSASPDRLLGRVVASFRLIAVGVLPLGALFGGWVARQVGLRFPYLLASGLIAIAAIVIYRVSTSERVT